MAQTKTVRWDPAEHLQTKPDMAAYLEATLQDDDPAFVAAALGDIARTKGMPQLARDTGLGREIPHRSGTRARRGRCARRGSR
jgi:probable addiction module antidote protein